MASEATKLPGVTLYWNKGTLKGMGKNKTALVTLDCSIADEEVWAVVEKKLRSEGGYRIYSVSDFKTEMLNVLNEELEVEQAKVVKLEQQVAQLEFEKARMQLEVEKARALKEGLAFLRSPSPST
jgi:hypothetical protein